MNETTAPPVKQNNIYLPLNEFLTLSLRQDDFIEIPTDLAFLVKEHDKSENLCHLEFPSASNNLKKAQLWHIKAWRADSLSRKKSREKAIQDKIEFDNMKININNIATKLSSITGMPSIQLIDMARELLRKNPENCDGLDIKLIHPYYRGEYVILPFREQR